MTEWGRGAMFAGWLGKVSFVQRQGESKPCRIWGKSIPGGGNRKCESPET